MTTNPVVSVVVSCYNHASYVETCIMSILGQTYQHVQLIVIDDGSKDECPAIIQALADKYGFFFLKQTNIGLAATLNKAIKNYAKGDYIALIASDDYWNERKLERQMAFFAANPDISMCCGVASIVNGKGEITGTFGNDIQPSDLTFDGIFKNNKIPALTVVVKKEVFPVVGYFNENSYIEDWEMWLRVADQFTLGFVNDILAYYRMHGTNISGNAYKMIASQLMIIDQWKSKASYRQVYTEKAFQGFVILARNQKMFAIKHLILPASRYFYRPGFIKGCLKLLLPPVNRDK